MKTLKVVSKKERHADIIRKKGSFVVNGITFRRIDGEVAAEVTEAEARIFAASEGFSIYDENGNHMRTCGQTTRLSVSDVAAARGAEVASPRDTLNDLLSSGMLSEADLLAALGDRAPVIQTTPQSGELSRVEVGSGPSELELENQRLQERLRQLEAAQAAPAEVTEGDEDTDGEDEDTEDEDNDELGDLDETDPEKILKLPRAQLFGLARAYDVDTAGKGRTHQVIAEEIAAAAKAAKDAE